MKEEVTLNRKEQRRVGVVVEVERELITRRQDAGIRYECLIKNANLIAFLIY